MESKIRRIIQSLVNPLRWYLQLVCGHEVLVTAEHRPVAKVVECPVCSESVKS